MQEFKPTYKELEQRVQLLEAEARWRRQAQEALKEREEMLRASEEKYRRIFENVFDVIFLFDKNFKILDVSPSIERILGYKPGEIIGRSFPDVNILTPESLKKAIPEAVRALSGESVLPTAFEFVASNGTIKVGDITANPLFKGSEIVAVIGVAREITDKISDGPLL